MAKRRIQKRDGRTKNSIGNPQSAIPNPESEGCLVALAVFKTDVAEQLGQAGSIPVRLRQRPAPVRRVFDRRPTVPE